MSSAGAIHERRDEVLRVAARHGAGNVRLFGSAARGEDTPDSDIDLLVDVTGATTPWFPGSLTAELEQLLGKRVQVVIRRSLSPLIREAVLADTRSRSEGSRSAVKSQRAYAMHVLECIARINADSASGRDAAFGSHTLQDAIVRNLQVLFGPSPLPTWFFRSRLTVICYAPRTRASLPLGR
jgi:hypothetical protein